METSHEDRRNIEIELQLGKAAAFVLANEGVTDCDDLVDRVTDALELTPDAIHVHTLLLIADDGRLVIAPEGLRSAAGAHPESQLEFRIRNELVRPLMMSLTRSDVVAGNDIIADAMAVADRKVG
jgi:hypothetical protein